MDLQKTNTISVESYKAFLDFPKTYGLRRETIIDSLQLLIHISLLLFSLSDLGLESYNLGF